MNNLKLMVLAAEDKRGENILVLDTKNISYMSDYFVIVDAPSSRQVKAIAENIKEQAANAQLPTPKIEGFDSANWILLDFGDIIVHIFDKESRQFYQLERLWNDAKVVDISEWIQA